MNATNGAGVKGCEARGGSNLVNAADDDRVAVKSFYADTGVRYATPGAGRPPFGSVEDPRDIETSVGLVTGIVAGFADKYASG
jgi:hypothetical protein